MNSTKTSSTTAEARRNAKAQAAYMSLRCEGELPASEGQQEYFTCASQSTPGTRYTITHDLVTGRTHCNCDAGQWGKDCKHQAATRRYIAGRAATIQKQAAYQATWAAEQKMRDTAIMRRNNQPFSLMA